MRHPHRIALAAVLVHAAVVRILFFRQIAGTDLAAAPLLDSRTYHLWALDLARGDWGWGEAYWMGPLYPHALALVYALGGGIPVALAAQLVLSWLNVLLTWRLARSAGGRSWLPVGAAALFGSYGAAVFYAGQLLMATLATTLLLVAVDRALAAWRTQRPRDWFVAGLCVGLAGLCRGNMLALLAAVPALLWLRSSPLTGRARLRAAAAMVLGGLLALAPVTVRNLVVAGDFVLLTSNGGVNLLIGQQADNAGLFGPAAERPDAEYDPSQETALELELGRDLKGSEVSAILTGRAWRLFRDDLARMPALYAGKIYRFWNGYEIPQVVSFNHWRGEFTALLLAPLPYVALSALGLLGLRFAPRGTRPVLAAVVIAYFLSLLPFFPTSRYRQPLAPVLAVTAAFFVWAMIDEARRRRTWLPAAVLLVLALWPRWARIDPAAEAWQVRIHQASRAGRLGDVRGVLRYAREAEEVRPGQPDTPFLAAVYLDGMKADAEAAAMYRQAERRSPDSRLVPYYRARVLQRLDRDDEALAALARAAELDPAWGPPWHRRALILAGRGDRDGALAAMGRAHTLDPGSRRIRANLAAMHAEAGAFDRALPLLESLTRDYPRYVNGWFNLALARWQSGDASGARAALGRAAALRGLDATQREQIGRLRDAMAEPAVDAAR